MMNTRELQQLKMAWLAAKEAGDTQAQVNLLLNHPEAQAALIDFIAGYAATAIEQGQAEEDLLPLTQRAYQTALERVFDTQMEVAATNLRELRARRGLTLVNAARGLRLGVDVWKKFEDGAIELASLSQRQLERLASFFQVGAEQFGTLLTNSQPALTLNRRQTDEAARQQEKQGQKKQSFAEAIEKSSMTKQEKKLWLE
ncbi:MAG TPA: helix-turn-helix transcriptional regulator [Ktedonobacteraceae bacterium]|nr:helix-turn-helix transcriptional regulator [Ktedonobacteraceae bacterium]